MKRTSRRRVGLFAALALAACGLAADPFVETDVAAQMRDGVVLRADVARPARQGRFPVLVYRTPYGKRAAFKDYSTFERAVARGYAVVIQDVRGRHASEGDFEPYRNEGRDGYDTIEWAAAQPWSNGSVGTFGLSYPGAVQWLAALESPPHLKAMAPAMTFSTPRNFFHSGGVFDLSWLDWIWNNIAADVRVRKKLPGPTTDEEAAAAWRRVHQDLSARLPLTNVPELEQIAPYYFTWMSHPPGDPWWDWCEIRNKYGRVQAAVLNLSGWYDDAYGPEGAVTNFLGLATSRRDQPQLRARLVLGPWVHGVSATAETASGDRRFGRAAAIDYDELILRWMDRHVRGLNNGIDGERPVRVFVMGENAWHESEGWPLAGLRETPLYLGHAGAAGPGALRWNAAAVEPGTSTFVSDPGKPVSDPFAGLPGAHDYREMSRRPDVLTYETEPLEETLTVVGRLSAEIFLSTDAPDTDLWVKAFDVAPDGTAFNLMSSGLDVLRASYRNGGPSRELLSPDQVYELRLDQLFTGNSFLKGHRIRVCLMAAFMPHFSRNLQTGDLEMVSSAMRTARLTVHHGGRNASRLLLPVLSR